MTATVTPTVSEEAAYLAEYDPTRYPRPSVAVDVVLLTVVEGKLRVMLVERTEQPAKGKMALPGGFVRIDESLDAAARRVLEEKAGLTDIYVEQLYTFGEPRRDPRTRVLSVAYYALVSGGSLSSDHPVTGTAAQVAVSWSGETGGPVSVVDEQGQELPLAFDHAEIIGMAVKRLRGKAFYAPIAFELVPPEFTMLELRRVYEAILGRLLNKDSFRKSLIERAMLVKPTGRKRNDGAHRPAELFEFADDAGTVR